MIRDIPEADRAVLSALVNAVAADTLDTTSAAALADWLEEHSLETAAGRVRRLYPKDGDVLVMTYRTDEQRLHREENLRTLTRMIKSMGVSVAWQVMPEGQTLTTRQRIDLIRELAGSTDEERAATITELFCELPAQTASISTTPLGNNSGAYYARQGAPYPVQPAQRTGDPLLDEYLDSDRDFGP